MVPGEIVERDSRGDAELGSTLTTPGEFTIERGESKPIQMGQVKEDHPA
jgi:hypothetical protein